MANALSPIEAALNNPHAALIEISRLECEESLAEFTRQAWHIIEPGTELKWNWHLDVICAYLEAFFLRRNNLKRLIVNVPPGSMKSILLSVMGPAWLWTIQPHRRLINFSAEIGLSTRDAMRMRDVITSDWYQARWGDSVTIASDQREKTHFANTSKGFRMSLGMGGTITGKRGNDLIIDDALDAKKAFSDVECQAVNDTYDQAVSSRLNDLNKDGIALIMQRLRTNDLTGHLLTKKKTSWTVLRIPMEYEGQPTFDPVEDLGPEYAHLADPRTRRGELMFSARFNREAVEALKEDLGDYGTAGQLQQRPSPLGGGIIKKTHWRQWPKGKPFPHCFHIFASNDTAFSEKDHKDAAYSARTTWGVFEDEETGKHALILLEAWWERVGYPELRKKTKAHHKKFNLDITLIEKKASGISLLQDMRRMRIPARGFNPGRLDKIARAHMASPMFESGLIYYPERQWAEDTVDYVASFPNGAAPGPDITDTVTQAVLYTKRKMWALPPDEEDRAEPEADSSEEFDEDNHADSAPAYG
ncbi:MAG: hypothetical protein ACRBBW_13125 [Cellvibrionaceae bacterium]